jgi:hypothetical protein
MKNSNSRRRKSTKNKHHSKTRRRNKNVAGNNREIIAQNKTPTNVRKISNEIARRISHGSYSPTINKDLVSMVSVERSDLLDCNIEDAFKLTDPLQIGIYDKTHGKQCMPYYTKEARKFLLKNLAANKHIDPTKIVTPIQAQSNCWFNAMFVTFFVSDKGRKFFHFLRQLMIEGKQLDGSFIPDRLRNAFALLNFGVDACLTGNEFAYTMNTNSIIHLLYESIPDTYKQNDDYIVDVNTASNPLLYYMGIIKYLNNKSIQILPVRQATGKWREQLANLVSKTIHLPHIIVIEIFEDSIADFSKKPRSFMVNNAKYKIDSAVVRDTSAQHFCTTATCEGIEMGYDGASFHRLVPLDWKHSLNRDIDWQFEGSKNQDGDPVYWNFMKCYQMLFYYREK